MMVQDLDGRDSAEINPAPPSRLVIDGPVVGRNAAGERAQCAVGHEEPPRH